MYFYYLPSSVSVQNQTSVKFNMHQKLLPKYREDEQKLIKVFPATLEYL